MASDARTGVRTTAFGESEPIKVPEPCWKDKTRRSGNTMNKLRDRANTGLSRRFQVPTCVTRWSGPRPTLLTATGLRRRARRGFGQKHRN